MLDDSDNRCVYVQGMPPARARSRTAENTVWPHAQHMYMCACGPTVFHVMRLRARAGRRPSARVQRKSRNLDPAIVSTQWWTAKCGLWDILDSGFPIFCGITCRRGRLSCEYEKSGTCCVTDLAQSSKTKFEFWFRYFDLKELRS